MRTVMTLMAVLVTTFTLSATAAHAADEIYRWVDENGVPHFADLPPAQFESEKVEIHKDTTVLFPQTSDQDETSASDQQGMQPSFAQQQREERSAKRREAAQKKQELAAECEQNRRRVAALEPFPRVIIEREDGSITRMDDNDRLKMLDEAKSFVASNCD